MKRSALIVSIALALLGAGLFLWPAADGVMTGRLSPCWRFGHGCSSFTVTANPGAFWLDVAMFSLPPLLAVVLAIWLLIRRWLKRRGPLSHRAGG